MKRVWLLPLVLSLAAAASAEQVRYVAILAGNRAGLETVTIAPDGERQYAFEYNDRGRGPKVTASIRLAADGTVAALDVTGNDYFKTPVDEHFSLVAGRARWKNKGEAGGRVVSGPAQYLSFDGPPDELGLLAQALLRAREGRIALLPEGEARIERVGEREVQAGGRARALVQYAISGLDFSPTPVWLERDGGFVASASNWFSVIREGWEDALPALVAAQDEADEMRAAALVKAAAHRPSGALVFRNVSVFDSEAAQLRPGLSVVVSGDRITAVERDGTAKAPAGAEIIDGRGRTLLPGLWDMHVHVTPNDGPLNIAAGVTSVRDMANDIDALAKLRAAWDAGRAIGPRVIAAGFIDGPGPYQGPSKILADNVDQGIAFVRRYHELGYPQIKLYSSLKPELVRPLVVEAHRLGMRVSGHIPAFMTAEQAVKDGYDEVQHVNMLFLNFWADSVPDTRTPARFTAVAEKAADLDLDSPAVRRFLSLLKEHETIVDPTVAIFEGMFTDRPGQMAKGYAAIADRLPATIRRGFLGGGLPVPEGKDQRYRDSFQALLRMVKRLDDDGIRMVAGTDGLAGFTLHRELELYVQAGLAPSKVLQIVTLGGARVMKQDAELGSIVVGKQADLLLVEGDPVADISDIRRTALVVKGGTVYSPVAVYQALGVKP
jgi:cytosine/adenosine deaminase-related metal-dependent hydrolase